MALNANKVSTNSGTDQDPVEPGVYPARVCQMIDLGLQAQRPYMGKDKPPANEISIGYELVDEFCKDENGEEDLESPRYIFEILPLHSLKANKAKSTQRYEAIDPTGAFGGDFGALVDAPINVSLVHNKKGDKLYVNVANVSSMRARDAASCPPLKNPAKVFDLDAPDMEVFSALPEWIQTKIKSNLNYQGSVLQGKLEGQPVEQAAPPKAPKAKKSEEPTSGDNSKVWD
jgi:hypothetical protein